MIIIGTWTLRERNGFGRGVVKSEGSELGMIF